MNNVKEKINKAFESLKGDFGYTNLFQTPKVVKVVVSTGVGSITDKAKIELIPDRLAKITGQRPSGRQAKKSIATFKLREGQTIGYQVTLRGPRMYAFLDRLFTVALPRTRDFRGLSRNGIDAMGNYTMGIKEHTIFPETSNEELKDVFGMAITIVTTAKDKKEAEKFLEYIGVPFKKEEEPKNEA
jgi:large subunit ribosomal protein L5